MEVSRWLQAPAVCTWRKNPRFDLYAYAKRKTPFVYTELKDDSSAALPTVYTQFHLSYPGPEETRKYERYEIKCLTNSNFLRSFSLWIHLPSSAFSNFKLLIILPNAEYTCSFLILFSPSFSTTARNIIFMPFHSSGCQSPTICLGRSSSIPSQYTWDISNSNGNGTGISPRTLDSFC
jgi:hypothetical protein